MKKLRLIKTKDYLHWSKKHGQTHKHSKNGFTRCFSSLGVNCGPHGADVSNTFNQVKIYPLPSAHEPTFNGFICCWRIFTKILARPLLILFFKHYLLNTWVMTSRNSHSETYQMCIAIQHGVWMLAPKHGSLSENINWLLLRIQEHNHLYLKELNIILSPSLVVLYILTGILSTSSSSGCLPL